MEGLESMTLILEKNDAELGRVIERLAEWEKKSQAERPEGIHCSDLVLCLEQSAFRKLQPKQPSLEVLGYYVDGNTSDRALKNLFPHSWDTCFKNDVYFTPDAVDENGAIWEFKATRSNNGLSSHFGRQLSFYLALADKEQGFLLVRRLNRKYAKKGEPDTWQPFEVYSLKMDAVERELTKTEIEMKRIALEVALISGKPELAPSVKDDPELSWLCKTCLWKEPCWKAAGKEAS
jgi:hypothetical protein